MLQVSTWKPDISTAPRIIPRRLTGSSNQPPALRCPNRRVRSVRPREFYATLMKIIASSLPCRGKFRLCPPRSKAGDGGSHLLHPRSQPGHDTTLQRYSKYQNGVISRYQAETTTTRPYGSTAAAGRTPGGPRASERMLADGSLSMDPCLLTQKISPTAPVVTQEVFSQCDNPSMAAEKTTVTRPPTPTPSLVLID